MLPGFRRWRQLTDSLSRHGAAWCCGVDPRLMRSIGYAKVCCVLAASQEVSQESSTAHRRGYDGKSGSEMRTQSDRLDLFNSASLRLRRPLTRSTHMSLHVIHCSHVVSALY